MNKQISNHVSYVLGYKLPKLTKEEKQYKQWFNGISWMKGKVYGWDVNDNRIEYNIDEILKPMSSQSRLKIEMRNRWIQEYNKN